MNKLDDLKERINNSDLTVCIFGLGYVGLPLALGFAAASVNVIGLDTDRAKVASLERGCSPLESVSNEAVSSALAKRFVPTSDPKRCANADAFILCVPTPLTAGGEPDLCHIIDAMCTLIPFVRAGQILSLESTTWPGTTDEVIAPRLRAAGVDPGVDFALVYSPEREDPGNLLYTTRTIPKVIGGSTKQCLEVGEALYALVVDQLVPVGSTRAAELVKLTENVHRAVNIALVNELKLVSAAMNIDFLEVLDAAATKPFGFTRYQPGPGVGGHCIPIDPCYLSWKARQAGVSTPLIDMASHVNALMPAAVAQSIINLLGVRGISLNDSRILVLGITYKKNIDDLRESPAVEILSTLIHGGADVQFSDPYVCTLCVACAVPLTLNSVDLDAEAIADYDCVAVLTDHDAFDYAMVAKAAALIIDTRGRFKRGGNVFAV